MTETAPSRLDDTLAAAHDYVRRGYGVVPLYGVADDACLCQAGAMCPPKNRGKHPRGTKAGWRPLTGGADVQAWYEDHPDDNIGIITGPESGIFVLDVDGASGVRSVSGFVNEHGALPATRIVRTGSGGLHYFFRHPGHFTVHNSTSYLAPGIDIRGKGGQVVAPPSVSGRGAYELIADAAVAEAPEWLLTMLADHARHLEHGRQAEVRTAEPVEVELLPERVAHLRTQLVGMDEGRYAHFYGLVAACKEAGYTQGQTVTIVAPWCAAVDKFVGRIEQEVARTWGKLEAEAARAEEWLPGLGQPAKLQNGADLGSKTREDETWPTTSPTSGSTAIPAGPTSPGMPPLTASSTAPLADSSAAEPDVADLPPSWAPVDLGPILDGSYEPEVPLLFPRLDGVSLVYAGRVHSFHGESESGKSLVCQYECARVLRAGGKAAYLDFESDAGAVVARLLDLGAPREALAQRFTYRRPGADPFGQPREREAYGALLREEDLDLVIIDGTTDALGVFGAGSNDMDEVAAFQRRFPRLVAARTGAAVIMVDHVSKDSDSRGRHAVGSQAKLNGLDGAAYVVEIVEAIGRGLAGTIVLRLAKDRIGHLRARCGKFRKGDRTQEAARITVDSTGDAVDGVAIRITVAPPLDDAGATDGERREFRPTANMEKVSRALEELGTTATLTQIRGLAKVKTANVGPALKVLTDEGFVLAEPVGRGLVYSTSRPYRSEEDPASDDYLGWAVGGVPPSTVPTVPTRSLTVPKGSEEVRSLPTPPVGVGNGNRGPENAPAVPSVPVPQAPRLVSCRACFRPTPGDAIDGLCGNCARLAGLAPS